MDLVRSGFYPAWPGHPPGPLCPLPPALCWSSRKPVRGAVQRRVGWATAKPGQAWKASRRTHPRQWAEQQGSAQPLRRVPAQPQAHSHSPGGSGPRPRGRCWALTGQAGATAAARAPHAAPTPSGAGCQGRLCAIVPSVPRACGARPGRPPGTVPPPALWKVGGRAGAVGCHPGGCPGPAGTAGGWGWTAKEEGPCVGEGFGVTGVGVPGWAAKKIKPRGGKKVEGDGGWQRCAGSQQPGRRDLAAQGRPLCQPRAGPGLHPEAEGSTGLGAGPVLCPE